LRSRKQRSANWKLIDRLAALVPPPRIHRHRQFGVLVPTLARDLDESLTGFGLKVLKSPLHSPMANAICDDPPQGLTKDRGALLAFYDLPAAHWQHAKRVVASIARARR